MKFNKFYKFNNDQTELRFIEYTHHPDVANLTTAECNKYRLQKRYCVKIKIDKEGLDKCKLNTKNAIDNGITDVKALDVFNKK